MYLKIHSSPEGDIVALCDDELLGRVLTEGKIRLDLKAHGSFYKGGKVTAAKAVEALKGARNANLVGKGSLSAAKSAGLDVSGAIMISGVPHLQLYRI
jgi:hypothetical protein